MHATLFAAGSIGCPLATADDEGIDSASQSDHLDPAELRSMTVLDSLLFRSRPNARPRAGWRKGVVLKPSHVGTPLTGDNC